MEQWRSLIMAQLKSERERALGLRSGPERERAGGERGAKDNCGDGHDVGGREARKERERRLDLFTHCALSAMRLRDAAQVSWDRVRRRPRSGKRAAVRRAQGF